MSRILSVDFEILFRATYSPVQQTVKEEKCMDIEFMLMQHWKLFKNILQKYLSAETYEAMRMAPKKNHNTEIISL